MGFGVLVDELSSLVDDLAVLEPWQLTGAEVREVLVAAQRARTGLDALVSRLAGAADGMGLPREDGASSTTAWLAGATGMGKGEAAKLVALARVTSEHTEHTEATRVTWAAGRIGTDQAR